MAASRRTALITGAGRNIGRACALGLAADGFNVVINGSSDRAACDRVAREARKLGVKALVVMGDVGKPEECKRIAGAAIKAFGAVDVPKKRYHRMLEEALTGDADFSALPTDRLISGAEALAQLKD